MIEKKHANCLIQGCQTLCAPGWIWATEVLLGQIQARARIRSSSGSTYPELELKLLWLPHASLCHGTSSSSTGHTAIAAVAPAQGGNRPATKDMGLQHWQRVKQLEGDQGCNSPSLPSSCQSTCTWESKYPRFYTRPHPQFLVSQ